MKIKPVMFRSTFIVAVLCLLEVVIEARPRTKCIEQAADIMFVLDSSTSIWIRHYREQLKFVTELVDSFGVGNSNSQVRVGAITYSDQSHLEFSLDHYTDPAELKKAILDIPHMRGDTNTADALRLLKERVEPNLKNSKGPTIAIVITDGKSMDPDGTKEEARKLHQLGINVYAIGVGNSTMYDIDELKAIASDPDNGVYTVSSYSTLKNITQTFSVNVCEGVTTTRKPATANTTTNATPAATTSTVASTTTTAPPATITIAAPTTTTTATPTTTTTATPTTTTTTAAPTTTTTAAPTTTTTTTPTTTTTATPTTTTTTAAPTTTTTTAAPTTTTTAAPTTTTTTTPTTTTTATPTTATTTAAPTTTTTTAAPTTTTTAAPTTTMTTTVSTTTMTTPTPTTIITEAPTLPPTTTTEVPTIIETTIPPTTRKPETGALTTEKAPPCSAAQSTDVVFIVNKYRLGQKKTNQILKASAEVRKKAGSDGAFRYSTIFDNCSSTQSKANGSITNESRPISEINFECSSLSSLLEKIQHNIFPRGSWNVLQAGLLFLDNTIDLNDPQIFTQAKRMLFENIQLYAVIIGDGVDMNLVQNVLAPKELIISVESYETLPYYLPYMFAKRFCSPRQTNSDREISIA